MSKMFTECANRKKTLQDVTGLSQIVWIIQGCETRRMYSCSVSYK